MSGRRRTREQERARGKIYRQKYRDQINRRLRERRATAAEQPKEDCRHKFHRAVKAGWVERRCEVFHHPDYTRPYYGAWMTKADHQRLHAGLLECPPCENYAEVVARRQAETAKDRSYRGGKNAAKSRWGKPRMLTLDGETRTIQEWSKIIGIIPQTISARLRLGWSVERTLRTPSAYDRATGAKGDDRE